MTFTQNKSISLLILYEGENKVIGNTPKYCYCVGFLVSKLFGNRPT